MKVKVTIVPVFGTIIIMTDVAKGKARRFPGIKHRFAVNTGGFNVIRQSHSMRKSQMIKGTVLSISPMHQGMNEYISEL